MQKAAKKSKPAKRGTAAKVGRNKQFLRWREWRIIDHKMHDLAYVAQDHEYEAPAGSKEANRLAKRMISLADALYKAAGAK